MTEVGERAMAITLGAIALSLVAKWCCQHLLQESPESHASQESKDSQDMSLANSMIDFARKVQVARQSPTPQWVSGARPSDECIAIHREEDPHDKAVLRLNLTEMLEDRKSVPRWPVPAQFQSRAVNARGVPCHWANWPGIDTSRGIVLYLHGGAMVTGNPDVHFCAQLSRATNKAVLTVDYRMAPEHPLPAATEDVINAYRWLTEEQHVPPGKIAIYGRSSGATLVVLALQGLLKQELPLPACGIPVSVWVPHVTQPEIWQVVVGNTDALGQSTGKNHDVQDANFNVLSGEFQSMPPLYVMVGELENVDRDVNASMRLSQVATEAGMHVKLDIVGNMQHCPDEGLGFVPEAIQAVTRASIFMDDAMRMRA